jgi:hypothetical protein
MDMVKWVRDAIILAVGAFILWTMTDSFVNIYPGYSYYGWGIMSAYATGVIIYLRNGLKRHRNESYF